ncbi:zinc-finger domain-containing protein [Bacillus sp. RG28]|uniref:Zinc-finger domain-containing protein n=1 Tax=Gottfriedia endophytica TaxID=2820819 RepID=A0A940NL33_9BACI|nr:zinc-finger domain-containing protein [Gottfriedia endophytica]MBP0724154.1 zinc-finger domain-containing protein [Gottfriedia endophytica]
MERKQVFAEVDAILKQYCEGCFIYKHFRKEHNQRFAQSFCIHKCTVGEKLREYGQKLSNSCHKN